MSKLKAQSLKQKKAGYAMIIVLIIMLILLAVTYLFSDSLFAELAIARNNKGAQVSFSLAEAGVQEAIFRIRTDATTRQKFMETTNGVSTFSHNPALINNGSYSVTIQNTALRAATITSVGNYRIGALRTARREIKVGIAQASSTPYPYDGAIFGGGGAGESIADIDFWYAPVQIFGGSLLSNRDINFRWGSWANIEKAVEAGRDVTVNWSISNCECSINDDGDPETPQCSDSPGCTPLENQPNKTMPPVDFDSTNPGSIKSRAIVEGHYYAKQKDFKDIFPKWSDRTFTGVYYIDESFDLDYGRTMRMNGILAASGSINITLGQLFVNPPTSGPYVGTAGVFTQKDFRVGTLGNFGGRALVYASNRNQIDSSIPYTMDFTGGFLGRRMWISGFRVVNIHFDADIINSTLNLFGLAPTTPVIEINHWEEEY